jgi:hypothetical protein
VELANDLIFVSIAAYRDPQLVPTIEDCIKKARHPERLRFGICWQHGPEEIALPFLSNDNFRIVDVPWRESQGACWARAEVMKQWRGEPWFLQVDSHCRFVAGWDTKLLEMMQQTGSVKPILSTYATPFEPGPQEILVGAPLQMALQGFTAEGIPHMRPLGIRDWQSLRRPLRARFISAGFLFAPGVFVQEVPYDPELYFLGEEAAMTLRAFTNGYDFFHPYETIVWHDYVRRYAVKHWDDHTEANQAATAWAERDQHSRRKVARLLAGELGGEFGLGSQRTVADFEDYAGLSFGLRRAQDYTTRSEEPPNPMMGADWAENIYSWLICIRLKHDDFPAGCWDDFSFWYIGVHDEFKNEIYRRDLSRVELASMPIDQPEFVLVCELQSGSVPVAWTVWPVSRSLGWLKKIEGVFAEDDYTIVLEEPEVG